MKIKEREVQLKDGRKVWLKSAVPEHAEAIRRHRYITSGETYFMVRYPEECMESLERMQERLSAFEADEKDFCVTAFLDGNVVGDSVVYKMGSQRKFLHRCCFGISILQEYGSLGLGSLMLETALEQAKENGFEQMELGVFEDNTRAIGLYEKYGFYKVGRCPHAFRLKDGTYRDEIQMVRMMEGTGFPFLSTEKV